MKGIGTMKFMMASIIASSALAASLVTERLSAPPTTGFVVESEAEDEAISISRFIPEGETSHNWTRMIVDARNIGSATKRSPLADAEAMAKGLGFVCPGSKFIGPDKLKVDGHDAARLRADCPQGGVDSIPRTLIVLVIGGDRDLLSRTVSFSGKASKDDLRWADQVLNETHVCVSGSSSPSC